MVWFGSIKNQWWCYNHLSCFLSCLINAMVDYIRADTLNLLHVAAVGPLLWYSHDIDIEIMRGIAVLTRDLMLYWPTSAALWTEEPSPLGILSL